MFQFLGVECCRVDVINEYRTHSETSVQNNTAVYLTNIQSDSICRIVTNEFCNLFFDSWIVFNDLSYFCWKSLLFRYMYLINLENFQSNVVLILTRPCNNIPENRPDFGIRFSNFVKINQNSFCRRKINKNLIGLHISTAIAEKFMPSLRFCLGNYFICLHFQPIRVSSFIIEICY